MQTTEGNVVHYGYIEKSTEKIIETPTFGEGKKNNDFGLGFYCTKSEGIAKEWAVSSLRDGFANRYIY